jgi:hypothetical protein
MRRSAIVFLLLSVGLTAAGCTRDRLRSGAPGLAPPLETVQLSGAPVPIAKCAVAILDAAGTCDDLDYGLGVEIGADGRSANLICYNTTPGAVEFVSGMGGGLIPILIAHAMDDDQPKDSSNTKPPRYTAVLTEAAPQLTVAEVWALPSMFGDEYYLGELKKALSSCSAVRAEKAPVSAPAPSANVPLKPES